MDTYNVYDPRDSSINENEREKIKESSENK